MKYWTTRRGKKIAIKDMATEHIYNCMRFLYGAFILDGVFNRVWSDKLVAFHTRKMYNQYLVFEKEYLKRIKS